MKKEPHRVVVGVGGVGYEVFVPLTTYYKLPEIGEIIELEIKTHVTDSSIELYGFCTGAEREIFSALMQVPGIGPRLARAILSGIEAEDFRIAVARNDVSKLRSVPRVGTKLAEKIILELKDKIAPLLSEEEARKLPGRGVVEDLITALVGLGYKRNQIEETVVKVAEGSGDIQDLSVLLKQVLRKLSS